jgi:hypothetical protein
MNPNGPDCPDRSCDGCIESNLAAGCIPACFFLAIDDDVIAVSDWTYRSFADWVRRHEAGLPD